MSINGNFEGDIIYLKSIINYTEFHFHTGKTYLSSYTLKKYQYHEKMKGFIRVNNSFLINPNYIESVTKSPSSTIVQMKNGQELTVSRRRLNTIAHLL